MKKFFALLTVILTIMVMTPISVEATDTNIGTAITRVLMTKENSEKVFNEVSKMELIKVITYTDSEKYMFVFQDDNQNVFEAVLPSEGMEVDYYGMGTQAVTTIIWPEYSFGVVVYANGKAIVSRFYPETTDYVEDELDTVSGSEIKSVLLTSDNCTALYKRLSEMQWIDFEAGGKNESTTLIFVDTEGNIIKLIVMGHRFMSDDYIAANGGYEFGRLDCEFLDFDFVVVGYANGNIIAYIEED